jgi:two-component system, cell cycle sensor histidine kinase and response regulator CckA
MGGIDTAAAIKKIDPLIPLIVSSGYADDAVLANPHQYGFAASLRKPFTQSELMEILGKHVRNA